MPRARPHDVSRQEERIPVSVLGGEAMSVNAALFERENEPEFFARKCRRCKCPEGHCECENEIGVARYSCGNCSPARPCSACIEATNRANGGVFSSDTERSRLCRTEPT